MKVIKIIIDIETLCKELAEKKEEDIEINNLEKRINGKLYNITYINSNDEEASCLIIEIEDKNQNTKIRIEKIFMLKMIEKIDVTDYIEYKAGNIVIRLKNIKTD